MAKLALYGQGITLYDGVTAFSLIPTFFGRGLPRCSTLLKFFLEGSNWSAATRFIYR